MADFNGLTLVDGGYATEIFPTWDKLYGHYMGNIYKAGGLYSTDGSKISVSNRGLSIGKKTYSMTDNCLNQLLSMIRLPVKYAKRIPNKLLLASINELISSIPALHLVIHNNDLLGISNKPMPVKSMRVIETLIDNGWKLSFAVADQHSVSALFRKTDGEICSAIEIYMSDTFKHKPKVAGWLLSKTGHSAYRDLEFPINETTNMLATNSVENFSIPILDGLEKYRAALADASKRTVKLSVVNELSARANLGKTGLAPKNCTLDSMLTRFNGFKKASKSIEQKREMTLLLGGLVASSEVD